MDLRADAALVSACLWKMHLKSKRNACSLLKLNLEILFSYIVEQENFVKHLREQSFQSLNSCVTVCLCVYYVSCDLNIVL